MLAKSSIRSWFVKTELDVRLEDLKRRYEARSRQLKDEYEAAVRRETENFRRVEAQRAERTSAQSGGWLFSKEKLAKGNFPSHSDYNSLIIKIF